MMMKIRMTMDDGDEDAEDDDDDDGDAGTRFDRFSIVVRYLMDKFLIEDR